MAAIKTPPAAPPAPAAPQSTPAATPNAPQHSLVFPQSDKAAHPPVGTPPPQNVPSTSVGRPPDPEVNPYTPKNWGGYLVDSLKDWGGLVQDLHHNPSRAIKGVGEMGRSLWEGAKATAYRLPDDWAGDQQYTPIGYKSNGNMTFATMADAQSTDTGLRSMGVKNIPFVGAVPSAIDSYRDFISGNYLDGAGNLANTALSLIPAGSISKAVGKFGLTTGAELAAKSVAPGAMRQVGKGIGTVLSGLPKSPFFGSVGELGRLGIRATPSWLGRRYARVVTKGGKEFANAFGQTAGIVKKDLAGSGSAFKNTLSALRGGEIRQAGNNLWQATKGVGDAIGSTLVGADVIGNRAQSMLLNPIVNLLPVGRRATATVLNRSAQSALPIYMGSLAANAAANRFAPESTLDKTLGSINEKATIPAGVMTAFSSPGGAVIPTMGGNGVKDYLQMLGIDVASMEQQDRFKVLNDRANSDSILAMTPNGPLWQSEYVSPVNAPGTVYGTSVPVSNLYRRPESTYYRDKVVSHHMNQASIANNTPLNKLTQAERMEARKNIYQSVLDEVNTRGTERSPQMLRTQTVNARLVEDIANGRLDNFTSPAAQAARAQYEKEWNKEFLLRMTR